MKQSVLCSKLIGMLALFFFGACTPLTVSHEQSSFYPYHFESLRVELVQLQYKQEPGHTVEHIPRQVLDSLVYRAECVLKFYPDDLVWRHPILLVLHTRGKQKKFWFNKRLKALSNDRGRRFQFYFKTPAKAPWARFTLGRPQPAASDSLIYLPEYENVFKSREAWLPQTLNQYLNL